uniref:E3 ubiquitin protein ligase n=1 Tax=Caenorhabditis japonica TaxID=281687 RepID=A0A8R1I2X1_CAEJA
MGGYAALIPISRIAKRNAFVSYAAARQQRSTDQLGFMKQIQDYCAEPSNHASAFNEKMIQKSKELAEQNERLQQEITKSQSESYNENRRKRLIQDKYELGQKKIEDLERQLDESKYQLEKVKQNRDKYESRLAFAGEEIQMLKATLAAGGGAYAYPGPSTEKKAASPASPPNDLAAKEIEALKSERDDQVEIASRRLQELNEANKKIQTISLDNTKLRLDIQARSGVSPEDVENSDEYKTLKRYYGVLVKELERVSRENEELLFEKSKMSAVHDQRLQQIESERSKQSNDIVTSSELHNTFYKVNHENEILRFEFEAIREEYNKTVKQGEWDELKASLNTMRSMVTVQRNELLRLRDTDKQQKKEIFDLKMTIREHKNRENVHIMVPIEEKDYSLPSPEDVMQLRADYDAIRKEIRNLAGQEKQDKVKHIENTIKKEMGERYAELEMLRKRNDQLVIDEQSISDELEEIGTAVEEEQERNAQLINEKRDMEDRNLKMMNDRMVQNQVMARMREKLDTVENKAQMEAQLIKMHDFEKKNLEESLNRTSESLQFKSAELLRSNNTLESNRKMISELGQARDELQAKEERTEETLKELQNLCTEKTKELEETQFKKKRCDEELDALKLKYERIKKNEAMGFNASGNGDLVLEEANRQMKETLTCPSCKTRPKDCIMLKCYHLFCETCIKTMYETRQRKCPKCASNFGANDFHRVFI